MPTFSGLWDGVHGDAYALDNVPTPPIAGGLLRVALQKRGLYGFVRGFGRSAPTEIVGVQAQRSNQTLRGGYDYATRQNDAANEVTVTHLGDDVNTLASLPAPSDATDADMSHVADTTRNNEYANDDANSGVTGTAWTETVES